MATTTVDLRPTPHPALRFVAAVLALESIVLFGIGVWGVVGSVQFFGTWALLGPRTWLVVGIEAGKIALFVLVPASVALAVGVAWWRRPALGQLRHRLILYLVAGAHAVVAALVVVDATALGMAVVPAVVVGAALWALVRQSGVDAPSEEPRRLRHPGRWAGGAVAAVMCVSAGSAAVAAMLPDDDLSFFSSGFPEWAEVCAEPVDRACAQRMAARSERTVAWLPDGDGIARSGLAVLAREGDNVVPGSIRQEAELDGVFIELSTDPAPQPSSAPGHRREMEIDGIPVTVRQHDDDPSTTLEWERDGESYALFAAASFGDTLDVALRAFGLIRYTEP